MDEVEQLCSRVGSSAAGGCSPRAPLSTCAARRHLLAGRARRAGGRVGRHAGLTPTRVGLSGGCADLGPVRDLTQARAAAITVSWSGRARGQRGSHGQALAAGGVPGADQPSHRRCLLCARPGRAEALGRYASRPGEAGAALARRDARRAAGAAEVAGGLGAAAGRCRCCAASVLRGLFVFVPDRHARLVALQGTPAQILPALLPSQFVIVALSRSSPDTTAPFVVLCAAMARGDWGRGTIETSLLPRPARISHRGRAGAGPGDRGDG